ncbi:MAG: MFS transporter [Abditibacteriota bacterium]|nr:MFS transporter [Abditibacteriota bacterium]
MFRKLIYKYAHDVPKDTRYNFGRDIIGNIHSGIFQGFYIPFIAIVGRKFFHLSPFLISLFIAGPFLSGIIGMVVSGFVPINKENKYMAYMGYMGCAGIIFVLPFLNEKHSVLYALVCFSYYIFASFGPLYMIIIERIYRIEIRAKLLGYSKIFMALSSFLCTLIAGAIIDYKFYGFDMWRACFVIGGLGCVCNMYFCFYKIRMPHVDIVKESSVKFLKESFKLIKTDMLNTWFIISATFFLLGYMTINTLIPIYQNDIMKIGPKEVAILTLIQNITWTFSYPFVGSFITRKGAVRGWILTLVTLIIMALTYIICPIKNWYVLLPFYMFFGLFMALNDLGSMSIYYYISGGQQVREYMALTYFFNAVRGILAAAFSAWIIKYAERINADYRWVFLATIICLCISIVIFVIAFKNADKIRGIVRK